MLKKIFLFFGYDVKELLYDERILSKNGKKCIIKKQ